MGDSFADAMPFTIISIFVCCLLNGFGADAFKIVAVPDSVVAELPNEVTVTCSFDEQDKDKLAMITHLTIAYGNGGHDLAIINNYDYQVLHNRHVWPHGQILDGVAGSSLSVVMWDVQQVTNITCKYQGLATSHENARGAKTTTIHIKQTPTEEDTLLGLQALKNYTKHLERQLDSKLFFHEVKLGQHHDLIGTDIMDRFFNLSHYQQLVEEQEKTLLAMEKRENTTVHFIATPHSEDDKYDGKEERVVYSNVSVNRGQGYDSRTGIFKAPVGGYYLFPYSAFVKARTYVYVRLRNEEFQTMDTILGGARDKWERSSDGSHVVYLKAGQEAFLSPGKSKGYSFDTRGDWYSNRFEGYLLKATDHQPQSENTYTIHLK